MLIYRNGISIFLDSKKQCHTTTDLSKTEFKKLQKKFKKGKVEEAWVLRRFKVDANLDLFEEARNSHHFTINDDGSIYRKGIDLSIPESLLREYLTAGKKRFKALDNFWKWCALNPNPEARDSLFEYLTSQKLNITNTGMLITYRNVNIAVPGDKKLHDYVVKHYLLINNMWKKDPQEYVVCEVDGEYELKKGLKYDRSNSSIKVLGTLDYCYKNLHLLTSTTYTDAHTGKEIYKIGIETRMPREQCDPNSSNSCSVGFHSGNKQFVRKGSFGNEGILVLINPKDVVAVPVHNVNKMRSCAFFPIGILEWEGSEIIEPSVDVFQDVYTDISLETLNYELSELDLAEFRLHTFSRKSINTAQKVFRSEMKKVLKNKVIR
jgi:hypothetical protein